MTRIKLVPIAMFAALAQACADCPAETGGSTTGSGSGVAYVDPCDEGGPYVGADYTDATMETVRRGGTVRAEGTVEHRFRWPAPTPTLAAIRVRIVPIRHASIEGTILPTLDVYRRHNGSDSPIASMVDMAPAAAYELPHDLVLDLGAAGEKVDDDDEYIVGIAGEAGPHALDVRVCGTMIDTMP